VLRPDRPSPSRGATLTDLDTTATLALPGVLTVVRDGSFLGVVAEEEEAALGAADRLRADAPGSGTRPCRIQAPAGLPALGAAETTVLAERRARRPGRRSRIVEATYDRPYLAHASMGPSSATALFGAGRDAGSRCGRTPRHLPATAELARALGLADDDVTVTHVEGPGCYGHNGADDAAMDAACSPWRAGPARPGGLEPGRRTDLGAVRAAPWCASPPTSTRRNVLSWQHEIWGNGHSTRPGSTGQSRFSRTVTAPAAGDRSRRGTADGAAAAPAAIPCLTTTFLTTGVNHRLLDMPLRTSALRSLGAFLNVFAAESFMDELALAAAGPGRIPARLPERPRARP